MTLVQRRLVERPFQTDMAIGQGADLFNVFALVSELWIRVILSRGRYTVQWCLNVLGKETRCRRALIHVNLGLGLVCCSIYEQ